LIFFQKYIIFKSELKNRKFGDVWCYPKKWTIELLLPMSNHMMSASADFAGRGGGEAGF